MSFFDDMEKALLEAIEIERRLHSGRIKSFS